MADTLYRVVLSFESQGNLGASMQSLGSHAQAAHAQVHGLKELGRTVGESFVSMGERAGQALDNIADKAMEVGLHMATIGAAAGAAVAAYGFHINEQLEETRLSMAAVFNAQGLSNNFTEALTMASGQLAKMKQDVKTLPGDLGQLSAIMKMVATPAAAAGADPDTIRKLAGRTMLMSGILGVNQEQAGREMGMILRGHAGGRNVLGNLMFGGQGEAHALTGMTAEHRLAAVQKKIETYSPAFESFSHTWKAQWTTLIDNVKYSMLGEATAPLFEHIKASVVRLNEYIDQHGDKIKDIADTVGSKLAHAWDRVEGIVTRIWPIVEKIGNKMLSMSEKDLIHGLGMAGAGIAGTKMAAAGLEGGSSLLGGLMKIMLTGGGGEGLMAGLGILLDPVTLGAAAVAAGALATAIVAVVGAFDVLTDSSNSMYQEALDDWNGIKVAAGFSLDKIHEAAVNLWAVAKPLVDTLGVKLLDALANGMMMVANFADSIEKMSEVIRATPFMALLLGKMVVPGPEAAGAAAAAAAEKAIGFGFHRPKVRDGMGGGGGGTHIQKVEIVVKGSDDPSRVARLTLEQIKQLGRNPKQSAFVPNYSRP